MNSLTQQASLAAKEYALKEDPTLQGESVQIKMQILKTIENHFLAGAQWQLTNLAEKGVEGAKEISVKGKLDGEDFIFDGDILDDGVCYDFIEALPVLAKINQLQEQVEKDKGRINTLEFQCAATEAMNLEKAARITRLEEALKKANAKLKEVVAPEHYRDELTDGHKVLFTREAYDIIR